MSGRVYYNEIDPYCAAWLRTLIAAGHLPSGEVDTRSIVDVRADDLRGYVQCHFFAGIGGWPYALRLAGWPDERCVWTGSCPCQPFSVAGKRKGFDDERHLWPVWQNLIAERRPATVFGEQVASAAQWLRLVRSDLEALGYAVGAIPLEAASAGAYHKRDRFWFVADADDAGSQGREILPERAGECAAGAGGVEHAEGVGRREGRTEPDVRRGRPAVAGTGSAGCDVGITDRSGRPQRQQTSETVGHWSAPVPASSAGWIVCADGKARRLPEPGIRLLAHGVPARVGKLRGFGNAIDPRAAAKFIEAVMEAT